MIISSHYPVDKGGNSSQQHHMIIHLLSALYWISRSYSSYRIGYIIYENFFFFFFFFNGASGSWSFVRAVEFMYLVFTYQVRFTAGH